MTGHRTTQEWRTPFDAEWEIQEGVRCVVCPGCAFTFDATHVTDATGEYDCPACEFPKGSQFFCGRTDLDPHTPHSWRRAADGSYVDYDDPGVLLWCGGDLSG